MRFLLSLRSRNKAEKDGGGGHGGLAAADQCVFLIKRDRVYRVID